MKGDHTFFDQTNIRPSMVRKQAMGSDHSNILKNQVKLSKNTRNSVLIDQFSCKNWPIKGDGWVHYNLKHSNRCCFSLPGIATQSTRADLVGILKEIISYGIDGLYARHGRVYNAFLHEPFFDRFS
jgi:hypothetical protein